jgi:hypothetical protein
MKKIDKLQKFLRKFTTSVYWNTSYESYTGDFVGDAPRGIDPNDTDWNQTLTTQINEVSARMYHDDNEDNPDTVLISGKFSDLQALIHSLLYMKSDITQHRGYYCIGKLMGKYNVLVIPQLEETDKIFICKLRDNTADPYDVLNYKKVGVIKLKI